MSNVNDYGESKDDLVLSNRPEGGRCIHIPLYRDSKQIQARQIKKNIFSGQHILSNLYNVKPFLAIHLNIFLFWKIFCCIRWIWSPKRQVFFSESFENFKTNRVRCSLNSESNPCPGSFVGCPSGRGYTLFMIQQTTVSLQTLAARLWQRFEKERKKDLKAQYCPLCFTRSCCCFGFHGIEASIIF